jgi:response regulator RpfG family c-di-GMP phosphodiesterase/DNA-binding CsgD family transcriptional regulator
MGLNTRVQVQLGQVYETWNGTGMPNHLKGDQIDAVVRLVNFGEDMQLFHRLGGVEAAVTVAKRRSGKAYDPAVASVFLSDPATFLAPLDERGGWERILAIEPGPRTVLAGPGLDESLLAIADFVDLKVSALSGHSRIVASLAREAGAVLGMGESDLQRLQRSAWLHEVGIVSISTAVLEKEARLTESEWERFRLHPYYTERVFANQPYLADLATLASLHHERVDGSGYHRGAAATSQPLDARVLAAACAYHLATAGQPGSPAVSSAEAAARLRQDSAEGKLDQQAVNAVLDAAGEQASRPVANTRPAGLSEREVEVLRLMTRGLSRKQIGAELFVADKTVARHIENIYDKIGVNTRPGAAVFAMQNGLLG